MMPTAISMCEPKVIGISVKTLYEQYGDTLTMGFIEKWKEDGKTYYDLYNSDGVLACCDGEEWPVEEEGEDLVTFRAKDADGEPVRFSLTQEELGVASFQ